MYSIAKCNYIYAFTNPGTPVLSRKRLLSTCTLRGYQNNRSTTRHSPGATRSNADMSCTHAKRSESKLFAKNLQMDDVQRASESTLVVKCTVLCLL